MKRGRNGVEWGEPPRGGAKNAKILPQPRQNRPGPGTPSQRDRNVIARDRKGKTLYRGFARMNAEAVEIGESADRLPPRCARRADGTPVG